MRSIVFESPIERTVKLVLAPPERSPVLAIVRKQITLSATAESRSASSVCFGHNKALEGSACNALKAKNWA